MQDNDVIKTFASYAPQKAFTDGIGTRCVIRGLEHLDATRLRNPSEAHPKLVVVITDEVLRPNAKGGGSRSC
jgi:hypothetical protein